VNYIIAKKTITEYPRQKLYWMDEYWYTNTKEI